MRSIGDGGLEMKVGRQGTNPWLFFKRWLKSPREMGSVTPSSPALGRRIAREVVRKDDEWVVEIGGGTGAITRELLAEGIPANRLFVIEIDPDLAEHLRREFKGVTVIVGDAGRLDELIPPEVVGKVGTVVCGIPMVLLSVKSQKSIVDAAFRAMPPGRQIVLYTYSFASPLPMSKLDVRGHRVGFVVANVPPANVWAFGRSGRG